MEEAPEVKETRIGLNRQHDGRDEEGWQLPEGIDGEAWDEWASFFEEYHQGRHGDDRIPAPPRLISDILQDTSMPEPEPADPMCLTMHTPTTPVELLEFFRTYRFLPAPAVLEDQERYNLVRSFGLDKFARAQTLDRVTNIAKAYFGTEISALSIQLPFRQVVLAENGWVPRGPNGEPGVLPSVALPCCFCPHSVTLPIGSGVAANQSKNDWRFAGNPFVKGDAPIISFYVSEQVLLPMPGQTTDDPPELMPAGILCVISPKPRPEGTVTEEDRTVLRELALLAGREIQLGAEMVRKAKQEDQLAFIGSLIRMSAVNSASEKPETETATLPDEDVERNLFEQSASKIQSSLGIGSCALLDVRLSQRPRDSTTTASNASWGLPIKVLGSTIDGLEDRVRSPEYLEALDRAIVSLYKESEHQLVVPDHLARKLLPSEAKTCKIIAVRQPGSPQDMLLLLLSSNDPFFRFDNEQDLKFARHVSSICLLFLAQLRIREADRAKLRFVSHISHECRTPLHSIASHFDLVREEMSPGDVARLGGVLDVTEASIAALKSILDDALDLSKLSHVLEGASEGTGALWNLEDKDLSSLILETVHATHTQFAKMERATSDERAGPFDVPVSIEIAPRECGWQGVLPVTILRRLVSNLVSNACKYTTSGGKISVSVREAGARAADGSTVDVVIEVADTGIGMDEEFIRSGKAVMPFVQADPFSNGAGLGLSMVDQLVRSLKGRMNIESKLGEGTTVTLVLPLQLIDVPTQAAAGVSRQFDVPPAMVLSPRLPASPDFLRMTISDLPSPTRTASVDKKCLVVEDNAVSRRVLMALMAKKGVNCHAAVDGQDAVNQYIALHPDLVLMDIQMPIKDGFEATREIRAFENAHSIPPACIMALTSQSHHDKNEADSAGMSGWIVKGGSANAEVNALLVREGFLV